MRNHPDTPLPRLHRPTAAAFRRFESAGQPCVITGVATEWPAMQRWDVPYLVDAAGDAWLDAHFREDGDFRLYYTPLGRDDRRIRLRDLLTILTAEPPDRRYFVTETDLDLLSDALVHDVDAHPYTDGSPRLFLGRDTCMPLHFHATTEALLCQLRGEKEVVLYSPAQYGNLYPNSWRSPSWLFSRIETARQVQAFDGPTAHLRLADRPDAAYPRFDRAQPLRVRLRPGEMLYLPVQWWHLTTCAGFQYNVTFFWRSQRRRYCYPQPGFQVLLREVWARTRGRRPRT